MKRFFLFGSSSVYGVGGAEGGIGDLLKKKMHEMMYFPNGVGEIYEVYNFSKSGAKVEFILKTYEEQLKNYGGKENIIIVSIGGNNTKAEGTIDNFVSSIEDYKKSLYKLVSGLKKSASQLICVGYSPVEEKKTMPIISSLTGGKVYFSNKRLIKFNRTFKEVCRELDVIFINIMEAIDINLWRENYLAVDGLHPNSNGHQFIYKKIWDVLNKLINIK